MDKKVWTYEENPQEYIKQQIENIGADNSKLTRKELEQKAIYLRELGKDQKQLIPGTKGTVYDPIAPSGTNLKPIQIGEGNFNLQPGVDTSNEVSTIEDLIKARDLESSQNDELNRFINDLPYQLSSNTEDFFKTQQGQAQRTLEENLIPETLQGLNARGLLNSGDVESELARQYTNVQSSLEQQHLDMLSQDQAFFEQAGYQHALQQALNAGENVSAQIKNDQGQALQTQQNRFQTSQGQLNRDLQTQLLQKEAERQQSAAQAAAIKQQNDASRANRNAMIGGISQAVGTIGGTVASGGNPYVGMAGGAAARGIVGG